MVTIGLAGGQFIKSLVAWYVAFLPCLVAFRILTLYIATSGL